MARWSEGYLLSVWGMVLLLSRSLLGPGQDVKLRPCWVAGVHAHVAVLFVLGLVLMVNSHPGVLSVCCHRLDLACQVRSPRSLCLSQRGIFIWRFGCGVTAVPERCVVFFFHYETRQRQTTILVLIAYGHAWRPFGAYRGNGNHYRQKNYLVNEFP